MFRKKPAEELTPTFSFKQPAEPPGEDARRVTPRKYTAAARSLMGRSDDPAKVNCDVFCAERVAAGAMDVGVFALLRGTGPAGKQVAETARQALLCQLISLLRAEFGRRPAAAQLLYAARSHLPTGRGCGSGPGMRNAKRLQLQRNRCGARQTLLRNAGPITSHCCQNRKSSAHLASLGRD